MYIQLTQLAAALQLKIQDNGVGFDTAKKRDGIGLQNIVSRANPFNGEVNINSAPGAGCELVVIFSQIKNPEFKTNL